MDKRNAVWRTLRTMRVMHEAPPANWEWEEEFHGGEETCGRVIINLHATLKDAEPGMRLLFISKDPAAPLEFPAWCRMTENRLLGEAHPFYLMEYKPHLKAKET